MKILTPVIGIPVWSWKKEAIRFARQNPSIIKFEIKAFCYECSRHKQLLDMFDREDSDYSRSEYYKYNVRTSKRPRKSTLRKINNFHNLYIAIKQGLYKCDDNRLPILTVDGCRLDGSHKLSIYEHLEMQWCDVNIFIYERLFSPKKISKIMKRNAIFRKETYNL